MAVRSIRTLAACFAALLSASLLVAAPASAQVRISQVYGGGGNSGATYKQDFIELFNAGTTAVAIDGWSVQYASAAGTSWQATALPNATLQPGQYFLVQQAAGAGTQPNLPTPDATGTLSMGGGAGKVALVASTTLLSGACPATWVDLVGYGTTASCQAFATNTTNAQSAQRKGAGCTDTDDNNADFEALTPVPRNTATTLAPCDGGTSPTDPSMTLAASPSTVQAGETVLFTATVVPGTNPASSNIVVLADLSALGGDAAQRLRDEGTFGDAAANDGIYSVEQSVGAIAAGTYPIPVGVADAEGRTDDGTVDVTVAALVAIHAIQGNGSSSPLAGQAVLTQGIVTARRSTGFFLQAPEGMQDADPNTSEGIFVYTGGTPAGVAVGDFVRVQATVVEFVAPTNPHQLPLTELSAPTMSVVSTGNALPPAVLLTTALEAPLLHTLEKYEGMRVSVPELRVVAPSSGNIDENDATSTTNGTFYGVVPGVARPMREEGVSVLDVTPFPIGVNPPVYDANPELLRVQSTALLGTTALAVNVHDIVQGLVGVLDYGFGAYTLAPDTLSSPATVTVNGAPLAVSDRAHDEITVAGFNLLRFYDDVNDPESDVVLTPAAVAKRLAKTASAICKYVKAPDILGVVEVENLSVLQDLADTINAGDTQEPGACASNPQYVAYLLEGNDVGGIDVGFLVSTAEVADGVARVEVLEVVQLGKDELLVNPDSSTTLLNDRPSLLLRARVHQGNGASRELTVIVNHLRSLSDVNSTDPGGNGWATDGARVRAKRAQQAKSLADVVHARQVADPQELIVLLGDFNAFEFSDGYVDSMGIILGDAAPEGAVMNHVASPVATPLTNLSALMAEADRYSFSFDGSAQSLDHLLVNQAILDAGLGIRGEHARINADFGVVDFGSDSKPTRVSDHDPIVLYLKDAAFSSADLAVSVQANDTEVEAGGLTTFGVGVANGGPHAAAPARVAIRVDATGTAFSVVPDSGWTCDAPVADGVDGQRIDCAAAAMGSGTSASFAVEAQAPAPGGGTLTLRASVDTPMTDAAPSNDLAQASVSVLADSVGISISDASATEGNAGTKVLTFTVSLSEAAEDAVTFDIATADATAFAGSDYVANAGTALSIPAGQLSRTFSVTINGDAIVEDDETFVVDLANVTGAEAVDAQGTGTITNDDGATLSIADAGYKEGNSGTRMLTFVVTLSQASIYPVTFDIATVDGMAVAGSDYTGKSLVGVTIPAGQLARTFSILTHGDTAVEGNETLFVQLANASVPVTDGQARGMLVNDDGPTLSIADASVTEGNAGARVMTFTVSLSQPAPAPVTFNFSTAAATAAGGSDFDPVRVTGITIPTGQLSRTLSVFIRGETNVEPDETLHGNISLGNVSIVDGVGVGTIVNDD